MEVERYQARTEQGSISILDKLESISKRLDSLDTSEGGENAERENLPAVLQGKKRPTDADLPRIQKGLDNLLSRRHAPSPEFRVLKQLYSPEIYSREDSVSNAHQDTYSWILEEPEPPRSSQTSSSPASSKFDSVVTDSPARKAARESLTKWLRSGTGIFHISGKPGAGKSTMMKYLVKSPRILLELEKWAPSAKDADAVLLFGHFYFWNPGSDEQQSMSDLQRSILFEVLRKSPSITPDIFPDAYHSFSCSQHDIDSSYFRPDDLNFAFWKLLNMSLDPGYKMCFFIDGLDEVGGMNNKAQGPAGHQEEGMGVRLGLPYWLRSRAYQYSRPINDPFGSCFRFCAFLARFDRQVRFAKCLCTGNVPCGRHGHWVGNVGNFSNNAYIGRSCYVCC